MYKGSESSESLHLAMWDLIGFSKRKECGIQSSTPVALRAIFPVFHVSQLKKCLRVPEERVEVRDIKLKSDMVYEEKPVAILDRKEQETRNRVVKL